MKSSRVPASAETQRAQPVRLERIDPPSGPQSGAVLAKLMDTVFVIPGTNVRFGLDALIGLFPGVGDAVGALISSLLIAQGARLGVPRIVLARMAGNVLLNSAVGAIPLFGDVFSVTFRSNVRNYDLLRKHAGRPRSSTPADWLFVGGLVTLMFAVIALIVIAIVMVVRHFS